MYKMGSHDPFGHLWHKLWQKERPKANWQFDSRPRKVRNHPTPCVQVECDTSLESSCRKLQLCLRPHPNQRSERGVIVPQNCGSPNLGNSEIPPWESQDKKPFGCRRHGEAQIIVYGGRWWLPPSSGCGEFCESEIARGLSQHQRCSKQCTNQLVGWFDTYSSE